MSTYFQISERYGGRQPSIFQSAGRAICPPEENFCAGEPATRSQKFILYALRLTLPSVKSIPLCGTLWLNQRFRQSAWHPENPAGFSGKCAKLLRLKYIRRIDFNRGLCNNPLRASTNYENGRLGGRSASTFNPQEGLCPSEEAFLRRGACQTKVDFTCGKINPALYAGRFG